MRTSDVMVGAVGGLAGGLVMMGVMLAGKKVGFIEEPLPVKIEHTAEERLGLAEPPGPKQETAIAQGGHLLFAAAWGAGYGALQATLDGPPIPGGPLFGLSTYAVDLAGLGPALSITPEPWNQAPMKMGRQLFMHVVFGTVTALVTEQVRDRLA